MHPLDSLFRPLVSIVNRQIDAKTPARELCETLEDRSMALAVTNTALALYFEVRQNTLVVSGDPVDDPDVVMSGSLLSLARLPGPAGEELVRRGDVDITGDALIAQQFRRLLAYGQPDFEEVLSGIVGDIAAHRVGEVVRDLGRWAAETSETMQQNVSEYLSEESRTVPTHHEAQAFRDDVEQLRDAVDRAEARVSKLEERSS